jgi:hypothetical protein
MPVREQYLDNSISMDQTPLSGSVSSSLYCRHPSANEIICFPWMEDVWSTVVEILPCEAESDLVYHNMKVPKRKARLLFFLGDCFEDMFAGKRRFECSDSILQL